MIFDRVISSKCSILVKWISERNLDRSIELINQVEFNGQIVSIFDRSFQRFAYESLVAPNVKLSNVNLDEYIFYPGIDIDPFYNTNLTTYDNFVNCNNDKCLMTSGNRCAVNLQFINSNGYGYCVQNFTNWNNLFKRTDFAHPNSGLYIRYSRPSLTNNQSIAKNLIVLTNSLNELDIAKYNKYAKSNGYQLHTFELITVTNCMMVGTQYEELLQQVSHSHNMTRLLAKLFLLDNMGGIVIDDSTTYTSTSMQRIKYHFLCNQVFLFIKHIDASVDFSVIGSTVQNKILSMMISLFRKLCEMQITNETNFFAEYEYQIKLNTKIQFYPSIISFIQ